MLLLNKIFKRLKKNLTSKPKIEVKEQEIKIELPKVELPKVESVKIESWEDYFHDPVKQLHVMGPEVFYSKCNINDNGWIDVKSITYLTHGSNVYYIDIRTTRRDNINDMFNDNYNRIDFIVWYDGELQHTAVGLELITRAVNDRGYRVYRLRKEL